MESVELLNFAKQLDTTFEVQARSCVSRAYYCAYHETKKYIENTLNIEVNRVKGGTHEKISKTLMDDKNPQLKGLGYKMVNFHARRVMADYQLQEDCSTDIAQEAIIECQKILKILEQLSSKK